MSGGKHVLVGESPTLVTHGATAGTARPAGASLVQWRGTVAPTNAVTNDEWYDQANDLLKRWSGTAWKVSGSASYAPGSWPAWAAGFVTGRYAPERQAYNEAALRKFRAALAKAERGGATANIFVPGDSIAMGANGSSPYTKWAWPNQLRDLLGKRYAHTADGFALLSDSLAADPRVVYTGTWAANGTDGIGGYAQTSVTIGSTIAFTPLYNADRIVVYYKQTADGAAAAAYSGAASGTINFSGSTGINSVTIDVGNANLSHTLTITVPSGANNRVTILGFKPLWIIGNAGGVVMAKAGINGATAGNFTDAGTLAAIPSMIAPHLTIIALETNDYGNWATPIATYKANIQALITAAKATGDVLLVTCPTPQDRRGNGGGAIPLGTSPVLSDYTLALYQLADPAVNDCALLDLQARWGDYATANANSLMSDDYHPSDYGQTDIAHAVFSVITEGVFSDGPMASTYYANTWTKPQLFGLGDSPGSEAVLVGGIDAPGFSNTNQPYVGASNTGQMRLSAKNGGQIEYVTDIRALTASQGFAKGPSQDYAGRFKGAMLIDPDVAPAAPSSGWKTYCDSGDGNKLKAIASTGTIVTIGVP